MDHHLSEHGATTADKVHEREEFRLLVGDIHELPETQKTALVLREMDALSYEQIAEAMETTVPSVKSLLVRARVSLAEAAEARLLSCDEVRIELAEVAEGLQRRPSPLVRRHLRNCKRCSTFRAQLKQTNKALAALLPVGPLAVLHKLLFLHLGHSAGAGSTARRPRPASERRSGRRRRRCCRCGRRGSGRGRPAGAVAGRWRGGGLQRVHLRRHRRGRGQGRGRPGRGGAGHRRRGRGRPHRPTTTCTEPPWRRPRRRRPAPRVPARGGALAARPRSYAEPRSTVAGQGCRHEGTPAPAPTSRRR